LHLLLPLHLLRGLLPSPKLLSLFPSLSAFYSPFLLAIRTSSLALYDEALASRQLQAVEGGVWLALERAREVVLRGVFKKVWVAGGRESRVKIESFKAGLRIGSSSGGKVKDEGEGDDAAMKGGDEGGSSVEEINSEEVECLVANMIYKVRLYCFSFPFALPSCSLRPSSVQTGLHEGLHLARSSDRRPQRKSGLPSARQARQQRSLADHDLS
jgi:hypothetical protein